MSEGELWPSPDEWPNWLKNVVVWAISFGILYYFLNY